MAKKDHRPKTDPSGRVWNEPKVDDRTIADALRETNGNKAAAAKALSGSLRMHISRAYVCTRIDKSAELQDVVEDIRDGLGDHAESNIVNAVLAGKIEDSKFLLTTIYKDRGYTKTTVVEDGDAAALAARITAARKRKQDAEVGQEKQADGSGD